jgi:hypothetical protein
MFFKIYARQFLNQFFPFFFSISLHVAQKKRTRRSFFLFFSRQYGIQHVSDFFSLAAVGGGVVIVDTLFN